MKEKRTHSYCTPVRNQAHLWRALEELGGRAEAVRRTSSVAALPPLCKLLLEIIGGRVFDCEDGAGDMVYGAQEQERYIS